ncbi:MAG: hypothetical protein KGD64_06965 [Candidatus Heimdallarchaeota archaeon]|nr:hypothetical protein [Candidatus Heimdallarchaeota archaeon]
MSKYLAIHPFPEPASVEVMTPIGQAVKAHTSTDAYWVKSWAILNEQGLVKKILCQWDAKDIDSIKTIIDKIPNLPTEGIYPLSIYQSEDFRK